MEFALVLPMLLVLLLGIADFGRVFSAGIVMEASARNAAEIAALERLRNTPQFAADLAYYQAVHLLAVTTACEESRALPTFDGSETCPNGAHDKSGAAAWFAAACVHDGADPICGAVPAGYAAPPGECGLMAQSWSNSFDASASYFVEVRTCYKFETLFDLDVSLPFGWGLSLGDVWLERTRTFVVDCPVGPNMYDLATNCPNAP